MQLTIQASMALIHKINKEKSMRYTTILSSFVLSFILAGCGNDTNPPEDNIGSSNEQPQDTDATSKEHLEDLLAKALVDYYNTGVYQYPIIPRMAEWGAAQSLLLDVTSVPEEILPLFSHSELLQLAVENPNIVNRYAYHEIATFVGSYQYSCNTLRYLLEVPDIEQFFLAEYLSLSEESSFSLGSENDIILSADAAKNMLLEVFLSDESMLTNIADNRQFLQSVSEKFTYLLSHEIEDPASVEASWQSSSMIIVPLLKQAGYLLTHYEDGELAPRADIILSEEIIEQLAGEDGAIFIKDLYLWINDLFSDYLQSL